MVSPACRKFLSKPQNTHNNGPAKIFFRQQHSAIYFPPKPFHPLSGWFPAPDSTVPSLCPTSLPHRWLLQLTQKDSGTAESIMIALCVCLTSRSSPKGINIRCHRNLLWSLWTLCGWTQTDSRRMRPCMSQEILLEWDEVIISSASPLPQARSTQGHWQ